MFKKLKDKLAEEVKSSPQRIQQFAQAAQAAVTSASSSISDITNNDLFSIGDNDSQKLQTVQQIQGQKDNLQDVSLTPRSTSFQSKTEIMDNQSNIELMETPRQRRLSNSSFASDVSFKLPSYESPSMYHFQSDMDVSASEAEERGLGSPAGISLDRVTKEQLYAAYRRTQDRYKKYRTQYADLARHYKLLERENAKARSVLVETQDKALRRISELREQCSLEQSAKAHLERALRLEIDEKSMKIDTLSTKIKLLQSTDNASHETQTNDVILNKCHEDDSQLIDLSGNSEKRVNLETTNAEIITLNNKIEKMEQLTNKYKESLKGMKEKNSQLTTELQLAVSELDSKTKENEQLKVTTNYLTEARQKIQELKEENEELQNKINSYDFSKNKELSTLEFDLQKAIEDNRLLQQRIDVYVKREEEYAISLAENKLSIHKELESKENEIKSLKDSLTASNKEIQSLGIVVSDYKNNIALLEEERLKLTNEINELNFSKTRLLEKEIEVQELKQTCQFLERTKSKGDEAFKCLELQLKQETAEKLAMIDRNAYLENKNKQICEENAKKTTEITKMENQLHFIKQGDNVNKKDIVTEKDKEINIWKDKYNNLELEIQDERVELVKLQSEIEKLLANHNAVQLENLELNKLIKIKIAENSKLQQDLITFKSDIKIRCNELKDKANYLRQFISNSYEELKLLRNLGNDTSTIYEDINRMFSKLSHKNDVYLKESLSKLEEELQKYKETHNIVVRELQTTKEEKHELQQQLSSVNQQHAFSLNEIKELNNHKEMLSTKLAQVKKECDDLKLRLEQNLSHHEVVIQELNQFKIEKQDLADKTKELENHKLLISDELNNVKNHLVATTKTIGDKNKHIESLEKNVKELTNENIMLQSKFENVVANFKSLETELSEVRKSHDEIESQKDHLNAAIELLEKKELKIQDHACKEIQTDDLLQYELESTIAENNLLKIKCEQIKQEKEDLYEKLLNLEQKFNERERSIEDKENEFLSLDSQFTDLKNLFDLQKTELLNLKEVNQHLMISMNNSDTKNDQSLEELETLKSISNTYKEENRRLKSDIEGLQTYLTKISKENSVLNDKLREVLSSSENVETNETSVLIQDIANLKKEIQTEKEKCDDLLRQNSLLTEENLELKDQLHNQNEVPSNPLTKLEDQTAKTFDPLLQDKYNSLLTIKNELEHKLNESEGINKSVNSNMKQLQDSNQKLRSSNDKLERRLDEALVSLRHLHSLQENTELEYLRNVLYEYLTGSGTHSLTLAKVLAAVVKFDEKQTNQVLLKEKERQGVLRQLGLL